MKSSCPGPESWCAYCTAATMEGNESAGEDEVDQFPLIGIPAEEESDSKQVTEDKEVGSKWDSRRKRPRFKVIAYDSATIPLPICLLQ